VSEGDFTEMTL